MNQSACLDQADLSLGVLATLEKEKERKDYAFWRQSNEKPRIILGCPWQQYLIG